MGNTQDAKIDKFLKELNTLHIAMMIGLIFVTVFTTYQMGYYEVKWQDSDDIFLYIVPLLAIGGVVFGRLLFNKKVDSIDYSASLDDKLATYRSAFVQKSALVEGPGLISTVLGMSSDNLFYMIITGILIVYFFTLKPNKERLMEAIGLNRLM